MNIEFQRNQWPHRVAALRTAMPAAKNKKPKSPYKHWKGPPKMDFQVKGRPDIDLDIFERGDPKEIYPLLRTDANFAGRYKEYLQGLGYEIGDPRRDIIGKLLRSAFRIAALDDENEDEESDGNYCSNCGPGDSDWCEDCEECKSCDNHENHCPSCGPNDSDWCEDCQACAMHDDHDEHCSSCGPNDSDWCEECSQCMNCDYHDNHCSYCGAGDSDWCEEHEQCKSCDGNCDSSDAQPLHLKTPLMRANERPMIYNDGTGEHEYYFSPNEINPASEAESRPYMDFPYADDEDPTLDFGKPLRQTNGIDNIPAGTPGAELYRGLTVDLRNPDLAELRRAIYGDKLESYYLGDPNSNKLYHTKDHLYGPKVPVTQPGMFPGPFSDKELASPPAHPDHLHRHLDALLDHMENSRKDTGLGRHWSTDFNQAMGFSNHGSPYGGSNLPVRMTARWRGQGENPYRHETGEGAPGDYDYEQEMNLLPGAPVELHNVEIFHPVTKKWHSLMDDPQRRTAQLFL